MHRVLERAHYIMEIPKRPAQDAGSSNALKDVSLTMATELGSTQHIENFPDHILVEIFSYLSFEDVVHSVYHVSSRFHDVAQDSNLWKHLQYNPVVRETDDAIANVLRRTPKLQELNLKWTIVGSPVLCAILENCSDLRKLTFNNNQKLSEEELKSFVLKFQKLEHLTIPDKYLSTPESAGMIGQFQKLQSLTICRQNYFSTEYAFDSGPPTVLFRPIGDGCPLLQHIDIGYLDIFTTDTRYLIKMKQHQLQSLSVFLYHVEGGERRSIIPHLSGCKTLKKLTINCSFASNVEVLSLTNMKNITSLSFVQVEDAGVTDLVNLFVNGGMSHLIELEFQVYSKYEDTLSETICNYCPLLKVLSFCHVRNMTERSLANLHKLKELEYLDLDFCGVTDVGIDFVCKCRGLKYLRLTNCIGMIGQSINQLFDLSMLHTLILDYSNIEGFPLRLIPSRLTNLRLLSIGRCKGVNLEEVHQLWAKMPHLTVLGVRLKDLYHGRDQ